VVVLAAVLALAQAGHGPTTASGTKQLANAGSQRIAAESAVRQQAVKWVVSQVGHDIIVGCDKVMCGGLALQGFPAADLYVIPLTAPDPFGAEVIISTADIRSQFGSKLASTYAPEVLASFGTGMGRIDIRVIAQGGAAAFEAALSKDIADRRSSGAQLLRNSRITTSASARAQLASGQVDTRLLTAIAFLSHQHPLDIVGFGGSAPGASPGVPLRYAYLAVPDPAAHVPAYLYVKSLAAVIAGLQPPYVPWNVGPVVLPDGQRVLQIGYPAPSPLDLGP